MINRATLLKNLQNLLPHIEKDILAYSEANAELSEHLQSEYRAAVEAERTAEHFVSWREAQITQAAVAWVLTCVFVRFLEDNGLLTEPVLAGPVSDAQGRNALQQAKERMVAYFNENPTFEERHYLLDLFAELEKYPVIAELLDHRHNPLWQIPVSADGAKRLIDFFQKIDADSGEILHDFSDPQWDTRFLGDLYQDLSESVRKRYALLQTPEFVESFILDYTLEPAIQTFGLPGLRLIDPTCGSGHFLLTTFERVFNQWLKREPGTNARELAQRALDVVHGTDINPYAIAICRFRLLIAAMKAAGSTKIKDAPKFTFNLACGDSLLHGRRFEWQGQGSQQDMLDKKNHVYEVENPRKLNEILGQRYHVVVGNPPYIIVKDKALNQVYRDKYPTCHRKYSLGVPFTERFFDLAMCPEANKSAGFVGMITANSFMKREFGKKLIEGFLPRKNLTHVIDTSGAYIPGHGTPTVIIFARNQEPKKDSVRSVLSIRGEPSAPVDPAQGKVWLSIVQLVTEVGVGNAYVNVADLDRTLLGSHPWSLGGGGAADLKGILEESCDKRLGDLISSVGVAVVTLEDEVFVQDGSVINRFFSSRSETSKFIEGGCIRDWAESSKVCCIFPYKGEGLNPGLSDAGRKYLWPFRRNLQERTWFRKSQVERGLEWFEYGYISRDKFDGSPSIVFSEMSTHNHFFLDRSRSVFKQTAPLIKMQEGALDFDFYSLLGVLNSSVVCFWMRQVFHNKGDSTDSNGARVTGDPAFDTYQYTGSGLKNLPMPGEGKKVVYKISKNIDDLLVLCKGFDPALCFNEFGSDLFMLFKEFSAKDSSVYAKVVALQEELDWFVYKIYGLIQDELCLFEKAPPIRPGERAFEINLARKLAAGESESSWFQRHSITPITDIPEDWPDSYKELVERRLQVINQNQWIGLIEQPEYKRRWNRDSWAERLQVAATEWLLDQCELAAKRPELLTCAQLADLLRRDPNVMRVAQIYCGTDIVDLQNLISDLVERDQVPQMAAARLKSEAMLKWFAWRETWDKQRFEDAIDARYGVDQPLAVEDVRDPDKREKYDIALAQANLEKADKVGDIPLPPQYKSTDFRKPSYWQLRGKLDVPKERFFSLPGCEKGGDSTLVIGWAGLNHLQRAQAIAAWYLDRKESEGWEAERLMPMLVALDELIPWLKQWHNEVDPEFGERMGDYYEGFLLEELRNLEITRADLLNWQPVAVARKTGGRKKKVAEQN